MKVDDILSYKGREVFKANENDPICKVLDIFERKRIGSCIVENDKSEIVGIMTEKDVLKCFKGISDPSKIKIKKIMTKREDLIIASYDDDIQYAMSMMIEHRIKHLPIFKDTKLCGMISIGDIIKAKLEQSNHVAKTYLDHILGKVPKLNNQEF